MRIISGDFKGRTITAPKNLPVRPTTDFAKGALFNILNNHFNIEDLDVLDLFSGTGNIAYEFISRGCNAITCVDVNYHCYTFIKKTLQELNVQNATVVKANVFSFLKSSDKQYDLIFADPPYEMEGRERIPQMVFEKNMLKKDGWLILEHPPRESFSKEEHFLETRNYSKVNFSIFGNK